MSRVAPVLIAVSVLALIGCNQKAREKLARAMSSSSKEKSAARNSGEDSFLQIDEDTSKADIAFMNAGKDFYKAIAAREYAKAYDMLSPYAVSNVSPDQFVDHDPAGEHKGSEPPRIDKLKKEDFLAKMKDVEKRYGEPRRINSLWVEESDAEILAGKKDRVSALFAIGAMPESTPANIRKAALRAQIGYKPKPEDVKEVAESLGESTEEVEKDDEGNFYFSLKTVLIEESGALKIGYFEFVPPSMLD